jgi:hypothetical protein
MACARNRRKDKVPTFEAKSGRPISSRFPRGPSKNALVDWFPLRLKHEAMTLRIVVVVYRGVSYDSANIVKHQRVICCFAYRSHMLRDAGLSDKFGSKNRRYGFGPAANTEQYGYSLIRYLYKRLRVILLTRTNNRSLISTHPMALTAECMSDHKEPRHVEKECEFSTARLRHNELQPH